MGVKGMLLWGCLPLWGRDGVILIITCENISKLLDKIGFVQKIK
jgi:hypothetical protein